MMDAAAFRFRINPRLSAAAALCTLHFPPLTPLPIVMQINLLRTLRSLSTRLKLIGRNVSQLNIERGHIVLKNIFHILCFDESHVFKMDSKFLEEK